MPGARKQNWKNYSFEIPARSRPTGKDPGINNGGGIAAECVLKEHGLCFVQLRKIIGRAVTMRIAAAFAGFLG